MRVSIDSINSAGIRAEMSRNHYTVAELLGTYTHPVHSGNDWTVRLYRAADSLVFATNADPVWDGTEAFDLLVSEYGVVIENDELCEILNAAQPEGPHQPVPAVCWPDWNRRY